jgi:hypothetical protein
VTQLKSTHQGGVAENGIVKGMLAQGQGNSVPVLQDVVSWLRDCAARIARENSRDLRPVHYQLRIINSLAREILALKAART